MCGPERGAPVAVGGGRGGLGWAARSWMGGLGGRTGVGYVQETEPDLAAMVSEFLEIGSGGGAESFSSNDGDSASSDLTFLAHRISLYKLPVDQYESDLELVVYSLILSMTDMPHIDNPEQCNASCIRFRLVELLRSSGYDAAVCATKWQGSGKIPGGEYEFIKVTHRRSGQEHYIIDIDFRSHFEIARAVKSYNAVLNSLPPVFVGIPAKLKLFLQIMAEAIRCSLKQNKMPLPPWRSLEYLEAKWRSPGRIIVHPQVESNSQTGSSDHHRCTLMLRRIKSSIKYEINGQRMPVP